MAEDVNPRPQFCSPCCIANTGPCSLSSQRRSVVFTRHPLVAKVPMLPEWSRASKGC